MPRKKKSLTTKDTKSTNGKASPPTAKAASPQIEKADLGGKVPEYEKGSWSGKVQFQCKLCAFDCLEDEGRMLDHLLMEHSSEAALEYLIAADAALMDVPPADHSPPVSPQIDKADLGGSDDDFELIEVEVTDEQKAELEALKENEDGKS